MATNLALAPVVGRFVICTEDSDYIQTDDGETVWTEAGEPATTAKFPVYFEQSAGDSKAKYWTKDLAKAFVFSSISQATQMLATLGKPEDCQIMALAELPENTTV